ncbi:MAG: PLD nuclease N-terminal domain-containing protein [Planctomycetota bacterium]|nr:PLDc_N domain-containing protein [Planctomycetaceae bacterium]MDQ3332940.1 PLD nuclease N-terminal domain-containing protein [Planctomycetota bacterium]
MEFFGLAGGALLIVGILVLLSVIVWIWALVDAATNPALDGTQKLIWLLVIFFTEIIGAIAYFVLRPSRTAVGHGGTLRDRPL